VGKYKAACLPLPHGVQATEEHEARRCSWSCCRLQYRHMLPAACLLLGTGLGSHVRGGGGEAGRGPYLHLTYGPELLSAATATNTQHPTTDCQLSLGLIRDTEAVFRCNQFLVLLVFDPAASMLKSKQQAWTRST
jgi:hypothetical protein